MIDFDKFKYRIGDRIHKIDCSTEYEVIEITRYPTSYSGLPTTYRIKNLSQGCLDRPFWISQYAIERYYEPCNTAIKLLYNKEEPTTLLITGCSDSSNNSLYRAYIEGTPPWQFLSPDRAGEQSDPHSLDALRYLIQPLKVSR